MGDLKPHCIEHDCPLRRNGRQWFCPCALWSRHSEATKDWKAGLAQPRIHRKDRATKIMRDGRVILSPKDYQKRREEIWEAQSGECADCREAVNLTGMHLHHVRSRGMAGGKRDDRRENLKGLCCSCHFFLHVYVHGMAR